MTLEALIQSYMDRRVDIELIEERFTHMGCALKWNPHERSWDCPCHGSRFAESGELLENPATGNLKHPPKR